MNCYNSIGQFGWSRSGSHGKGVANIQAQLTIALVVAAAENGVIGRGGTMPWRIPSDLKTFKRLTLGKPVVMGRKTFASLGKPLPGRDNIVVTRDPGFRAAGIEVAGNVESALVLARASAARLKASEIMVIGGAEIYRQALPLADRVYLTRVHGQPEGDTYFPDLDPEHWQLEHEEPIPPTPYDDFTCTLQQFRRIDTVRPPSAP